MVFFRSQASELSPSDGEAHESLPQDVDALPDDLLSEQAQAYLRLLSQLAACGLDAAGPPLLPARTGS
jgi:hypothetical protein